MKKILFFFCLYNFAWGQIENQVPTTPYIEVIGTAKKEIEPNQIHISISLTEKSVDNKKYSIEHQESKLFQILAELNISNSKLTLSDLTSSIITEKRKEIGYKQKKKFNLILENGQQVADFFDKLFDANIKEADVIKIDHTDLVLYHKEVRIEALKAAKSKAEYLTRAIGHQIGKPLEIIEIDTDPSEFKFYRGNIANYNSYTPPSESEFKNIEITFSYRVKYSIE